MTKKSKAILRISFIGVVLVIAAISFVLINHFKPKEIPQKFMTMGRAIENGSYATAEMGELNLKTMDRVFDYGDEWVKVQFLSEFETTGYVDATGNLLEKKPEEQFHSSGKLLYYELINTVWKMRVDEVIVGNLSVGDEIDVMLPILEEENPPTVQGNHSVILGLSKNSSGDNYFMSGVDLTFYLENGRIYPGYDLEDFTKEYMGMKEDTFKRKLTKYKLKQQEE